MYRARTRRSTALVHFCRNDRRLPPMTRGSMDNAAVVAGNGRHAESSDDSIDGRSAPTDTRGRLVVRVPNARDPSPVDGRRGDSEAEQPANVAVRAPAAVKVSYSALSKPKNGGRVRSYPEVKRRAGQLLQPLAVCEVYHISRSVVSEVGQELEAAAAAAARYRGGGGGQPEDSSGGDSTGSRGPPRVASDVKCVRITFDNSVLRHAGGSRPPGGSGGSSDPVTGGDRRLSQVLTANAEAANFAEWSAPSATRSWPSATAGRERRRPTAAAAAHERRDAASSARSGATQQAVSSSPKRDSDFFEFEDDARSRFRTHAAAAAAAAPTYDDEAAAAAARWPLDAALRERTSVLLPRLVKDGSGDEVSKQHDGASGVAGFALPELQAAAGDLIRPPTRRARQTLLQKKFDETLRIFRKTRERIFELNSEQSRLADSARAEPTQHGQLPTMPSATAGPKCYSESMNDAYARAAAMANVSRRSADKASLTEARHKAAGGLLPPIPVDNETGAAENDIQQTLTFGGLASDDMARPSRKVMFEEDIYAHFRHNKYRKRQVPTRKRGKRYEELDAMQFLNVKVGQS